MANDIVEKLFAAAAPSKSGVLPTRALYGQAATEITSLRAELAKVTAERDGWQISAGEWRGVALRSDERAEAAEAQLAAANEQLAQDQGGFDAGHDAGYEAGQHDSEATIATLTEDRDRMRRALGPFADQAATFDSCGTEFVPDEFEPAIVTHTIGDLRRAREAYDASPPPGQAGKGET